MKERISVVLLTMFILTIGMPTLVRTTPHQPLDDSLSAQVDQLFAKWDTTNSPGAAIAIVKDGLLVYKAGYGSANLEYDIPIVPSSVFNIASIAKQFTAFAIITLVQAGELSLDDDIRSHLDEVPDFGRKMTIRHLIHHTSGLRSHWPLFELIGLRLNDDVTTNEDVLNLVKRQRELNFNPGDEYLYCNTGYTLLAEIVERVSGISFREYTDEKIFKPLGMNHSHFHDDHEMIIKNRTYAYKPGDSGYKKSISNNEVVGNGHLFTTVEDLTKWISNFRAKDASGATNIELMRERGVLNDGQRINYAFGLDVDQYRGLERIGHDGGHAGYRSYLGYFPEQNFGVVVLSNLATVNSTALAMRVADLYLAEEFPESSPPMRANVSPNDYAPSDVSIEELKEYVGYYHIKESNTYRRIYAKDAKLYYHRGGQNESQLLPLRDGRFLMLGVTDEWILTELPPKSGAPKQLRWYRNGKERALLQSYKPWAPLAVELSEYEGRYFSEELQTAYTILLDEAKLLATHPRNGDAQLKPRMKDKFKIGSAEISFERNNSTHISGFRISTGRARNLLFKRRPLE